MPDLRVSAMKKNEIWPFWRVRSNLALKRVSLALKEWELIGINQSENKVDE